MTLETRHVSVLPDAVRETFTMPRGTVLDATAGGGGHIAILLDLGHDVIAMDRDPAAIERIRARFGDRVRCVNASFSHAAELGPLDGILADLGFSSDQLEDPARGFSFLAEGIPDMRMDPSLPETAADLVERSSAAELERILREYGEEPRAYAIARRLAGRRFATAAGLASACGAPRPGPRRIHPATRVFQALRIAVNDELGELERLLALAPRVLRTGGRIGIISFHSLEDRLVKNAFVEWRGRCRCPPGLPQCGCGAKEIAFPLWKGCRRADESEVNTNPRARSARMRAMERTSEPVEAEP